MRTQQWLNNRLALPLRNLLLACVAAIGLVAVMTRGQENAASAGPVRATSFDLVDADGQLRGRWTTGEGATNLMSFFDDKRRPRFACGINPEGGANLLLMDVAGNVRTLVAVSEDGASTVTLLNASGAPAGSWTAEATGRVTLEQFDTNGTMRQQLAVNASGSAGHVIFDRQQRPATIHQIADDGSPGLVLYSPQSEAIRLAAYVNGQTGLPMLTLNRADESALATLAEAAGGGALMLNDRNGRQRGVFGIDPAGEAGVLISDGSGATQARLPDGFDLPGDSSRPAPPARRREGRSRSGRSGMSR